MWRADLNEDLLRAGLDDSPHMSEAILNRVASCPPTSTEAMSVPIGAVRRWLKSGPAQPVSDTEGMPEPAATESDRPWLRWRGVTGDVMRGADSPSPGDVVVVPAGYGGISCGSWDPTAIVPVVDLATQSVAYRRRVATVRCLPALWPGMAWFPDPDELEDALPAELDATARQWLAEVRETVGPDHPCAKALQHLVTRRSRLDVRLVPGPGWGQPTASKDEHGEAVARPTTDGGIRSSVIITTS